MNSLLRESPASNHTPLVPNWRVGYDSLVCLSLILPKADPRSRAAQGSEDLNTTRFESNLVKNVDPQSKGSCMKGKFSLVAFLMMLALGMQASTGLLRSA